MKSLKNIITNLVLKVWPVGNSPLAPYTIYLLLAYILGYIVNVNLGSDITLIIGVISGLVAFYFTKLYINYIKKKNLHKIVIDEFSGQMTAISAAVVSPLFNFIAFILSRFFNILKPGIISKSENFKGALGIMIDDWLAGIFIAIILIIFFILGYKL